MYDTMISTVSIVRTVVHQIVPLLEAGGLLDQLQKDTTKLRVAMLRQPQDAE